MVRRMSETSRWRCGRSVDNPPNYLCCQWLTLPEAVSRVQPYHSCPFWSRQPLGLMLFNPSIAAVPSPTYCFGPFAFNSSLRWCFVCGNRMAPQSLFCLSALYPTLKLHRLWVELHVGTAPCAAMCCASTQLLGASKLVRLLKRKPGMHWPGGALTRCPRSAQLEEFRGVGGSSRI